VLEVRPARTGGYLKFDRDELIDQIEPANVPESFDDEPVGTELL
jgi:hypothetical protein